MGILILGDGDFSFTKSIVKFIHTHHQFNIISTCYESLEEISNKYSQVVDNIEYIKRNGVSILTCIDATNLSKYDFCIKFDLIIFNFPHIGGKSNIKNNRNLLSKFFQSVKESNVLDDGLICMSLCQGQAGTNIDRTDRLYGNSWQIEEMAAQSDFFLYDIRQFDLSPFGDYIPTGFRSQEKRFRLDGARTYIFKKYSSKNLDEKLICQIDLNGKMYFVASWIRELMENENKLCDIVTKDIIEMKCNEEYIQVDWVYVFDSRTSHGYNLIDIDTIHCMINDQIKICVLGKNIQNILHYKLSNSPWQQLIPLIQQCHFRKKSIKIITHGECFYTCNESMKSPVIKYIVSIQTETNITICSDETFASKYQKELSNYQINIISLKESDTNIEATIEFESKFYSVNIVNISRSIENQYGIFSQIKFANWQDPKKESMDALNSIFPTFYTTKFSQTNKGNDKHIRSLYQRHELDFQVYRDMSFWWNDKKSKTDDLLNKISEICRCVFRSHMDCNVSLVEDYLNPNTQGRSICVRVYMKSGPVPLSRLKINKLQSLVRLHCQNLINVVLR